MQSPPKQPLSQDSGSQQGLQEALVRICQDKPQTPQGCTWCPHCPHQVRAAGKAQANEIKLLCFSAWKIPISVSCDSSWKPKPPVWNQMTESRGKLLLEQQNVASRHADTPTLKHDPPRQRNYFLKTPQTPQNISSHFTWEPAPCWHSGQHRKKQWQSPKSFFIKRQA